MLELQGLFTLEQVSHDAAYSWFESATEVIDVKRICISRLPLRALLRHVSPSGTQCFWLSEHDSPSAIAPRCEDIERVLSHELVNAPSYAIVEGLDWMVNNDGEEAVLQFLQRLDRHCRDGNHAVIFVVDPLVFSSRFWPRLHAIAPSVEPHTLHDVNSSEEQTTVEDHQVQSGTNENSQEDRKLVQLVSLPRRGFNKTILSKRMLQWKRMGIDVSELEPAMATDNMDKAHTIYAGVESMVRLAVDLCRVVETNHDKLSVTEREIMTFQIMQLSSVQDVQHRLEEILASR